MGSTDGRERRDGIGGNIGTSMGVKIGDAIRGIYDDLNMHNVRVSLDGLPLAKDVGLLIGREPKVKE